MASLPFLSRYLLSVCFGGVGVGEDLHLWCQLIRSGWAPIRVWLPF